MLCRGPEKDAIRSGGAASTGQDNDLATVTVNKKRVRLSEANAGMFEEWRIRHHRIHPARRS
jgi:hypothetical protein